MIDTILTDIERTPEGSPSRLTRQGHLWIRTEMLSESRSAIQTLYRVSSALEHGPAEPWTASEVAQLRAAARLVNEMSVRLWLSSLFGLSYETE